MRFLNEILVGILIQLIVDCLRFPKHSMGFSCKVKDSYGLIEIVRRVTNVDKVVVLFGLYCCQE